MTSAIKAGKSTGQETHRRETFRYIVLPMIGVTAFVLLGVVVVLLLPKPGQVSLIADWLFTVFFLCPAVLCLFPIVIGFVAAVAGMNRLHVLASSPMKRLEILSETLLTRTNQLTDTINRQTVNASVKFAFLDRLLSIFDPPVSPKSGGNEGNHVELDSDE